MAWVELQASDELIYRDGDTTLILLDDEFEYRKRVRDATRWYLMGSSRGVNYQLSGFITEVDQEKGFEELPVEKKEKLSVLDIIEYQVKKSAPEMVEIIKKIRGYDDGTDVEMSDINTVDPTQLTREQLITLVRTTQHKNAGVDENAPN